jgi:AcrR family transcriptional regulator
VSESFDVVIVGARCAGSPLAALLAREGVSVALVEQARFPKDTLSGGWMSVRRHVLDPLLAETAERASADVRAGAKVVRLLEHGDRVAGVAIACPSGEEQLRARLVVGADGRNSAVARLVGAQAYHVVPNERAGAVAHAPSRTVFGRRRHSPGVTANFYEVFVDREDCFLATFDQMLADTRAVVGKTYASQSNWRDGVRAALALLLDRMDQSPGLAKTLVVESLAGGERVLRRRVEMVELLALAIDLGRPGAAREGPPLITAEAVVGGVLAVLHMHLVRNDPESFRTLLGPLMSMIVLPYRGPRAAAKELRTAPSHETERGGRARGQPLKDPFDGLKMRVTYRTTLVLAAIAERPGASNREVAEGSGIVDQGQISKLLSRLARLGLIDNHGAGQPYGAANQWYLTGLGTQLEQATRRR